MACLSHFRSSRKAFNTRSILALPPLKRWQSSASIETLQDTLRKQLMSRPPNIIYDFMSPTPSHLLDITLADFIPKSCWTTSFQTGVFSNDRGHGHRLPQGHHLVYFNPQVLSSGLLADGTDSLQSPDSPFDLRRWAGGALLFQGDLNYQLDRNGRRGCCTEKVVDVVVKGTEGNEKIFVVIQRHIGDMTRHLIDPSVQQDPDIAYPVSLIEERHLVYFRRKTPEQLKEDAAKPQKILKPVLEPDLSFTLVPTPTLLFRFSALTFNAHRIHLDPNYCREVEGQKDLLVHGPLTLTLMLTALNSQLQPAEADRPRERLHTFRYRNLAPLFVGEEMKICVRRDPEKIGKFDVWIEGSGGGYAVKGVAMVSGGEMARQVHRKANAAKNRR